MGQTVNTTHFSPSFSDHFISVLFRGTDTTSFSQESTLASANLDSMHCSRTQIEIFSLLSRRVVYLATNARWYGFCITSSWTVAVAQQSILYKAELCWSCLFSFLIFRNIAHNVFLLLGILRHLYHLKWFRDKIGLLCFLLKTFVNVTKYFLFFWGGEGEAEGKSKHAIKVLKFGLMIKSSS